MPSADAIPVPFAPWEIAKIEERRQAAVCSDLADECIDWAGGVAAFGGVGSWLNQAINGAMSGPVSREEVEAICQWFIDRRVEPKILLTTYSHPTLRQVLAEAGFTICSIETLFVTDLTTMDEQQTQLPQGTRIERVDSSDEDQVDAYSRFAAAIHFGASHAEPHIDSFRRAVRHPRSIALLLLDDQTNDIVAACGCEGFENLGALWGGAVAPSHRRRGIQKALIHERLLLLRQAGMRWATISSDPWIGTERNALRAGMRPAYTRLEMVRPGEGLVPSP